METRKKLPIELVPVTVNSIGTPPLPLESFTNSDIKNKHADSGNVSTVWSDISNADELRLEYAYHGSVSFSNNV